MFPESGGLGHGLVSESFEFVGTKLGGRPRPLRGLDPSLVPEPRTRITVT